MGRWRSWVVRSLVLSPGRTALFLATAATLAIVAAAPVQAANCAVNHDQLVSALRASVKPSGGESNGGLDNPEWAAVVARDGSICAIAFSGKTGDEEWPASRAIAAEKANTANGMSTSKFALSTANLYAQAQPGGYLFGAALSNPPNAAALYAGNPATFGTSADPLVGTHLGGVIVFGGGLALYNQSGIVGALGVSGDTSCADHNVAWRVRQNLHLDRVPAGPSPKHNDAIIYDIASNGKSASGFGHPTCIGKEVDVAKQIGAGVAPGQAR